MPIPFALLAGLALGVAFAWVAAPPLLRDEAPVVSSPAFAIVVAFATMVWTPIAGYFVAFHGDWSYLYLVPWRQVPSAIDLGLVLTAGAAVAGGFWMAVGPIRKRRLGPVVAMFLTPTGLVIAGLSWSARRLLVSGTYAQYHGDFGIEPIGSSALGRGVLLMGVVVVFAVGWTALCLGRAAE